MKKGALFLGVFLLVLSAVAGQDYLMQVKINTIDDLGQPIWSNSLERNIALDERETFVFEASNGSLTVHLSLHSIGGEELLLVADSSFQLDSLSPSHFSRNLKSISLKKGEKVVYYPLGKNDETEEGGTLFSMEMVISPVENGNI
jgi:hypothetical protein